LPCIISFYEVRFSTYAVPMIEGEIRRYLRDNSLLRVSRQIKDLSYQVLKEKEINVNEYGHIPSVEYLFIMISFSNLGNLSNP